MKKKQRKPKALGIAQNVPAAVAITGLPESVIAAARDAGCQAFKSNSTIACGELVDYVAKNPALLKRAEEVMDLRLERALHVRAARLLLDQRRLKNAEQLVPLDQLLREWTRYIFSAKNKLRQAESALAAEAGMRLGLSSEQVAVIKEIHMTHSRRILNELHQGKWGKAICPKCKHDFSRTDLS